MREKNPDRKANAGYSKTKLLLGAAGLLLFIFGLKRSHRLDNDDGPDLRSALLEASENDGRETAPARRTHTS